MSVQLCNFKHVKDMALKIINCCCYKRAKVTGQKMKLTIYRKALHGLRIKSLNKKQSNG